MTDIFLNEKLKASYMQDFNSLLKNDVKFWEIDTEFLKEKLININDNKNIQTIDCRYGIQGPDDSSSYLTFAFTKQVELNIFRSILPELLRDFNINSAEQSTCFYQYSKPRDNRNHNPKSKIYGMSCRDNKDHYRINAIRINLDTLDDAIKKRFWTEISLLLSGLK
ncbi:hypothetical protein [Xanthomarina sp.]|uniref:hypothetical protein n=1 Tax=Xanthomarina sp. TaxID=1931211 RepID=UPI002C7A0B10|nr:hypothetical protein [Xanthomarina sp.]HLV40232.1 hypothetical protein [Xanthomarina sp.]